MGIKLELPLDVADGFVVAHLKDSIEAITKDIVAMEQIPEPQSFEKEDLKYNIKYRKALMKTVKYFTTLAEHTVFEDKIVKLEKKLRKRSK